jgi:hypothetical protein
VPVCSSGVNWIKPWQPLEALFGVAGDWEQPWLRAGRHKRQSSGDVCQSLVAQRLSHVGHAPICFVCLEMTDLDPSLGEALLAGWLCSPPKSWGSARPPLQSVAYRMLWPFPALAAGKEMVGNGRLTQAQATQSANPKRHWAVPQTQPPRFWPPE